MFADPFPVPKYVCVFTYLLAFMWRPERATILVRVSGSEQGLYTTAEGRGLYSGGAHEHVIHIAHHSSLVASPAASATSHAHSHPHPRRLDTTQPRPPATINRSAAAYSPPSPRSPIHHRPSRRDHQRSRRSHGDRFIPRVRRGHVTFRHVHCYYMARDGWEGRG